MRLPGGSMLPVKPLYVLYSRPLSVICMHMQPETRHSIDLLHSGVWYGSHWTTALDAVQEVRDLADLCTATNLCIA